MARVEDRSIEITADELPSFLYESGTVYDPDVGIGTGMRNPRVSARGFLGLGYGLTFETQQKPVPLPRVWRV